MATYLLPEDGTSRILTFDLTVSEGHEATAETTDHPIEQGSNVTDHIRPGPKGLNLEFYISNTPNNDLGGRGSVQRMSFEIPRYEPPLEPTPGSVFRKLAGLIPSGLPRGVTVRALIFPEIFDRVKEMHTALEDIREKGITLSVVSSTLQYVQMALVGLTVPRTEPGGATFSLNLKQIKTVTTATVDAPKPKEKRGAPAQAKGGQSKKPVGGKDAAKTTSMVVKALQATGVIPP